MKYSITIKSALSLEVCVGEFETFEEAKFQMTKFMIDLINNQKDDVHFQLEAIDIEDE